MITLLEFLCNKIYSSRNITFFIYIDISICNWFRSKCRLQVQIWYQRLFLREIWPSGWCIFIVWIYRYYTNSHCQFYFLAVLIKIFKLHVLWHLNSCCSPDRDLQCDFNNMYWEESECAWSFKPSLTQLYLSSSAPFRMTRRLVDASTDKTFNYWQQKDTSFGRLKDINKMKS